MARRRAQRVQELNNVLQEQHAKEAHGCAGGRLHITQIGRARSAEQRTALPALPHRSHRMGASHPAALAATAAAPNLWRYVERPPIAPRAATTGVLRSRNFSGDAGMGEASASRSALSSRACRRARSASAATQFSRATQAAAPGLPRCPMASASTRSVKPRRYRIRSRSSREPCSTAITSTSCVCTWKMIRY